MKLCFATNNQNKVKEINSLLNSQFSIVGLSDIGCTEELEETQSALEGNSLQKARYVYDNYAVDVFADDTGLEVSSLNGEPGVKSARYAGGQRDNEANIDLLLSKLGTSQDRQAQFRTVITLIIKGKVYQFEGIVKGEITYEREGNQGFGYDSIFRPEGFEHTFAEMSMIDKNQISHRGIAMNKLIDYLNTLNLG